MNSLNSRVKTELKVTPVNFQFGEKNLLLNIDQLLSFKSSVTPHTSNEFCAIVTLIESNFEFIYQKDKSTEEIMYKRVSIANEFISGNVVDIFQSTLGQLFVSVFEKDYSKSMDVKLYKSTEVLMDILWKCTEISKSFGNEICKKEILLNLFYKVIKEFKGKYLDGFLSKDHNRIFELSVLNLYNTVIHDSESNIHILHRMHFIDLIEDFQNFENESIKIKLNLFAAYISDDNDTKHLITNQKFLSCLIERLVDSIKSQSGCSQGFTVEELAKGIEKISKFDENKRYLVELGILPVLKSMMDKASMKFNYVVLSILWNLAFDKRNREEINVLFNSKLFQLADSLQTKTDVNDKSMESFPFQHQTSLDSVSSLHMARDLRKKIPDEKEVSSKKAINQSDKDISKLHENHDNSKVINSSVSLAVCKLNGLLWTLKGHADVTKKSITNAEETNEKHIMISYCHKNSKLALEIYGELKKRDCKVWIDKYNMVGTQNMMEAMGQAVENSHAVVMCISHCYKNSESCRAEAQYAKESHKPLIPIIIQEKYRPEGWLGICIAGLKYINFTGKHTYEESIEILHDQIAKCSNKDTSSESVQPMIITDHSSQFDQENKDEIKSLVSSKITTWSNSDVLHWFHLIGIKNCNWKEHYAGSELEFLKTLSTDKFLEFCKTDLDLTDLKDIRILTDELKKL